MIKPPQERREEEMDIKARVLVATADGIAQGLLIQTEKGIRLTPDGMSYAEELWNTFNDLNRLLLAGYLKKATPDA